MTPAQWRGGFLERLMAAPERARSSFSAALAREGAQALTPVLCPLVIDAAERAHLEALVKAWHAGMHQALQQWAAEPGSSLLKLPAALEPRVREDALRGRAFGSTRYDFVVDAAGRATLIECQAGDPSGMGMEEASAAAFASLEALGGGLQRASIASSLRRFVAPHPATAGLVVFVVHRGAFVEWDVERLVKTCRAEGVDAVVADPSELTLRDGRLRLGDRVVAKVVRDSIEELLAPEHEAASRALMAAWASGVVEVSNPLGSIAADHKVLLGRLRAPAVQAHLSAEVAQLLNESVPETVGLDDHPTPERSRWVLKPSDGYGGFDVTVGPAVSDDAWRLAVEAARESGRTFLLQTFVPAERADFPVVVDGTLALRPHFVVRSGWMHGDRFGGLFARVRQQPVVNVHQGGGLLPVYTLAS